MTAIVIDANLALALVVPLPYSNTVQQLVEKWHQQAPCVSLCQHCGGYEVVSGLRKAITAGVLTDEEAYAAVENLWSLDLQEIPATLERHRQALAWAERLGQTVAFDAQYLVVSEELDAPFWTADKLLSTGARATGANWVRWIGDPN